MKKISLTLIAVFSVLQFSYAQWTNVSGTGNYYLTSGNAGIGTTTPVSPLDVGNGNITAGGFLTNLYYSGGSFKYKTNGYGGAFYVDGNTGNLLFSTYPNNTAGAGVVATQSIPMLISSNGNVGIGTTSPNANLQVMGTLVSAGANANIDPSNPANTLSFLNNTGQMLIGWNRTGAIGETDFIANPGVGSSGGFAFYNHSNTGTETQLMYITGGGNVLINKNTQINTAYKLDVNGSARANEIVVNTGGADFVFEPTYKLSSLTDVKKYIDRNHHLPEIPSAKTMQTEGLNVGDNQIKLLQKVEELTPYTIASDKHIKTDDAVITQQKAIVAQQKTLLQQQQTLLLQLQNQLKAQQKEIDQLKNSSHQ